jgi:hypothetical protein
MADKIGINPQTQFTDYTPYGIYAYTIKYALENEIVNLPYAQERDYIWVFKAKHPQRIKRIRDRSDKAGSVYMQSIESNTVQQMTKWFLDRGIEGFVDEGTSTIHPSEPYQAVFFGSQTIIPLDVFPNSYRDAETPQDKIDKLYQTFSAPEEDIPTAYGPSPLKKSKKKTAKVGAWDFPTFGSDDDDWDSYDPYDDPKFQAKYGGKKTKKSPL